MHGWSYGVEECGRFVLYTQFGPLYVCGKSYRHIVINFFSFLSLPCFAVLRCICSLNRRGLSIKTLLPSQHYALLLPKG